MANINIIRWNKSAMEFVMVPFWNVKKIYMTVLSSAYLNKGGEK